MRISPAKPLCEFTLAQYPTVTKCMKIYKKYVESMCLSGGGSDIKVRGGKSIPVEERVFISQQRDPVISACSDFIEIVDDALSKLKPEDEDFIRRKYFSDDGRLPNCDLEDFDHPRETVRVHYERAMRKIEHEIVEAWLVWDSDIKNSI